MSLKKNLSALAQDRSLFVPGALFVVLLVGAVVLAPALFTVNGLAGAILVATPLILSTLALTPIVMAGRGVCRSFRWSAARFHKRYAD